MKFASALLVLLCFHVCFSSANAEMIWGDIPLKLANEKERDHALSSFENITYLDSKDDLKFGEIYMIDIVDTNCLIAVNYFDITQVWVWDVQGEFKYGYEIKTTYHPIKAVNRSFCLSSDGTVLVYIGRGGSIIGLSSSEGQPLVSVYSTPTIIENLSYERPSRSTYKRYYSDKGKVIVTSKKNGEKITVVNFSNEYKKYISEKNAHDSPYIIRYIFLFCCFIAALIWGLRIVSDD